MYEETYSASTNWLRVTTFELPIYALSKFKYIVAHSQGQHATIWITGRHKGSLVTGFFVSLFLFFFCYVLGSFGIYIYTRGVGVGILTLVVCHLKFGAHCTMIRTSQMY